MWHREVVSQQQITLQDIPETQIVYRRHQAKRVRLNKMLEAPLGQIFSHILEYPIAFVSHCGTLQNKL
ncbi:CLUMA_CG021527, isoform A [Clunio marinus]|uniref:CLUMA_CG021527, isoform A n=1 Tax=Clunio marinus TaxID=568069 RepID=A0A1J1J7E8_9DIPT|nr:CLUMA_CG021527, isoform A [Clunio marinus]